MIVAMAGLPGAGKSTVAAGLSERIGAPVVSVDPIESAILHAGIADDQPTGLAAYLVAETIADAVLTSRGTVVVDAVNPVAPAREQWVKLAARHSVPVVFVEVGCSDRAVHRTRLEERRRELAHLAEPQWHQVEQRLDEWERWEGESAAVPRLELDTIRPLDELVDEAAAFVDGAR